MREALDQMSGYIAAFVIAFAGRMLALAALRPTLSWLLLWELPIVAGIAIIAPGAAEWMGFQPGHIQNAITCVMAYMGPVAITTAMRAFLRRDAP